MHNSSYSAMTMSLGSIEHAGQFGSRRILKVRKLASSASYVSRRPERESPRPSNCLIASIACNEPMIPGSTPSTPASAHDGAISAGGGSGNMHR